MFTRIKPYFLNLILNLFLILILQIPYFQSLNNLFIDQLHGGLPARNEIVIIGIDDKSLAEIGAWPWTRDIFADAIRNLNEANPSVVAFDIIFLEDREGDDLFQAEIDAANFPVVHSSKLIDNQALESMFGGENVKYGYVNFQPDSDGKIRSAELSEEVNSVCKNSFALSTFASYLRIKDQINFCNDDKIQLNNETVDRIAYFNYTDDQFVQYSFVDLLRNQINEEDLKDKIILIGSTAIDLRSNLLDNFIDLSGDRTPGIEIHAEIINSLLHNRFQNHIPILPFFVFILLLNSFLFFIYDITKKSSIHITILGINLIIWNVIGLIIFGFGINWKFITTNILLLVTYIFSVVVKYLREKQQKEFVSKAFGQYINPKLLNKLIDKPEELKLGGEKKDLTVLFSDIRGFTTISEGLTPEQLVHLLNIYLTEMSDIIMKHNGTIDKYIGDAIMAFWGAPIEDPNHRINAINASLEMMEHLPKFNKAHSEYPDFKIGIGLNSGDMVVGNIGSEKKFDYTLLGDNVNLGSRLEGLTKKYGIPILMTEGTTEKLTQDSGIIYRQVDEVIVKGKSKPVKIFEPLVVNKENTEFITEFSKAFTMYQEGDFEKATKILEFFREDPVSQMLLQRIEEIKNKTDWKGIWEWKEK